MAINEIDEAVNTNGVLVDGPVDPGEGTVEAANTVTPGALVIRGTAAGEIVQAGDEAINVIGYALENVGKGSDPAVGTAKDLRADFAAGARVRYNRAKGSKFMAILADGFTVNKGALLVSAGSGQVKPYAPDVTATVNEANVEAALAENAAIIARYIGEAAVTTSGATARILANYGGA